ncbi:hypothetical protein ACWC9R_36430 [Streptomyces sp. NPDC001219]
MGCEMYLLVRRAVG